MNFRKYLLRLIRTYLKGSASSEEKSALDTFFQAYWEKREGFTSTNGDFDNFLASAQKEGKRKRIRGTYYKMAAVITGFLVLSGALLFYIRDAAFKPTTVSLVTKITRVGEISKISFEDGTVVTINSQSKFSYPASFSRRRREVYLEGEAYFDVVHNPARPFIVHANGLTTHVLGTRFNIKSYPDEATARVTLVSGKIGVKADDYFILKPGEGVVYNQASHEAHKTDGIDVSEKISWISGKLIFKHSILSDALKMIERKYGLKIQTTPLLLNSEVTGDFTHMPVKQLIKNLAISLKATYRYDHSIYYLSPVPKNI